MYRNIVYNSRNRSVELFTWDTRGKRIQTTLSFNPYLYVESNDGDKTSIYNTKVKKRVFNTAFDRNKFVRDSGIKRLFENIPPGQQFLIDTFWQENETPEFSQHPLKIAFIDIETYSVDTFPDVNNPTHPINAITCYDNFSKKFNTFGTKQCTDVAKDVNYTFCQTERDLFIKFIEYFSKDYPDVLSGWSSEFFDIPYIINRCERVLGEEYVKQLSPLKNIYTREVKGKFGKDQKRYFIDGISCIDYLEIYRRFCLKLRESYKLDAIAELELGENKTDYGDIDLATLANTDWDKFIEYNIQDVRLLVKLEDKLQYISLLRMLSYVGLTTLERAMGTVSVINGAVTVRARGKKEVMSTFVRSNKEGTNPGAFVLEPKRGFKEAVVSFDANSLYPNVMISLNLSPETKVGKIEKTDTGVTVYHTSGKNFDLTKQQFDTFVNTEKLSITRAGVLFSQKKKGIIPEFLDHYYSERVHIKQALFEAKQQLAQLKKSDPTYKKIQYEVERLNTKQMVIKILINSCYGAFGNKQATIGDDDIAASVTLTGQAVIKHASKLLQEYLKDNFDIQDENVLKDSWVAGDTDSLYFSLKCISHKVAMLDNNGNISDKFYDTIKNIESYINKGTNEWARAFLRAQDPRFVFKRESIADTATFLQKKRYVMHILDDEGIKTDKYKYVGVEVVRTSMPNAIKPYAKKIIETMLSTKSLQATNKILNETFEIFKSLPPEEIATVMGIRGYEGYASRCRGLEVAKKMPIHVKSAYYHNYILDDLGIKHEKITSGDKVRYLYIKPQNKYKIETIGFKYEYNKEFAELFQINYELMFEKVLFNSIQRFYDSVDWRIRKPTDNVKTELEDLFGL